MDDVGLGTGVFAFAALAALGSVLLSGTARGRTRVFQINLFLAAFAIRFITSIIIYQFGLINALKDEDGSGWVVGVAYKEHWERERRTVADVPLMVAEAYGVQNKGYYYLLGGVFFFTGLEGRLVAAALNGFFGAMTAVVVYRTARDLTPERSATWVGWYTCLFPSLIIWSAQTIKEPVVIFLESVVLSAAVRLRSASLNPALIAVCVLAIVALVPFRFYAAYVAIVTVLVGVLLPSNRLTSNDLARLLGGAGLALLIALAGGFLQREASTQYLDAEYIEKFRRYAAEGQGSGVQVETSLGTTAGLGLTLVVGGLHLLLAPFPWQWFGGLRKMMVVPEVIFWWWLLWHYILPGTRYVVTRRLATFAPILLFLVLMSLLYSVMFSNVGLVYRQRAQLLPWLFIIAAVGRELCLRRKAVLNRPPTGLVLGPA